MNKGARLFTIYWGDALVAMFSVLNLPSGTNKYGFRVHRTVVLPDYQGLGIGTKILEFFGEWFLSHGEKMYLRSSHVRLANHCLRSKKWIEGMRSQTAITDVTASQGSKYKNQNTKRTPYSFEYVGEGYTQKEHQYIVCVGNPSKKDAEKYLRKIIDPNKYPIIVCGIASVEVVTVWEEIAKEQGIRMEVLWLKRNNSYELSKKVLTNTVDGIIIDQDEQKKIAKYIHADGFNSLITFDYRHGTKEYYEDIR